MSNRGWAAFRPPWLVASGWWLVFCRLRLAFVPIFGFARQFSWVVGQDYAELHPFRDLARLVGIWKLEDKRHVPRRARPECKMGPSMNGQVQLWMPAILGLF